MLQPGDVGASTRLFGGGCWAGDTQAPDRISELSYEACECIA